VVTIPSSSKAAFPRDGIFAKIAKVRKKLKPFVFFTKGIDKIKKCDRLGKWKEKPVHLKEGA